MGSLWRGWRDVLDRLGFASAARDARLLAAHAMGFSALDMALREHDPVEPGQVDCVAELLQRRLTGESVARIIGEREFYGLAFTLNAATLEPRPETELLVDMALAALPQGGRLLDLGTGTGCIPIAVLTNRSDARAVAVDLSALALDMAKGNAKRNGVTERVRFLHGSWFEPLLTSPPGKEVDPSSGRVRGPSHGSVPDKGPFTRPAADLPREGRGEERFDVIVSNPPYITSAVLETLAPEVKDFDPRLALDGGPDGLAPYRIIAAQSAACLEPGGQLLVEIGHDQGAAVTALLVDAGFDAVRVHPDLNGLDRVVSAHHMRKSD